MPVLAALSKDLLQGIDITLAVIGGLIFLTATVIWWQHGRPDPLRGSPIRLNRLTPVWLWLCVVGQLVCWLIGGLLIPKGTSSDPNAAPGPESMVLGANAAQALMTIVCLAIAHMTFVGGFKGLGIGRRPLMADAVWAVAGWLVALAACSFVYWITISVWTLLQPDFVPPEHAVLTTLKEARTGIAVRILVIGGALILAPVSEELFFRGMLQSGIKKLAPVRWGSWQHRWLAIVVAAVVFGTMHSSTPHHVPALVALGVILGYLYERTGSLVLPTLLHMLFNGKTLLWLALKA
jgi:membrane protease YdiL (CAAX protease family)